MTSKPRFLSVSTQNHAESLWNYLKKSLWGPQCEKLNHKSDFGHVRTYSCLNTLRNIQRTICGKYLGHMNMEYMIRRRPQWGGRRRAPVFLIILCHKYLWIFLIYSLYIPYIFPSYVPYLFLCVFLNLWSEEKISPYSKTMFLPLKFQVLRLLYVYQ